MGKDKLILKKPNSKVNPMEIYRKKMREKEKNKLKEKRQKHNNNPHDSNRRPAPTENPVNPLLENIYSSKKNNQIASINPDLISEDIDTFQTLFEKKPSSQPQNDPQHFQQTPFQDNSRRNDHNNKQKNRNNNNNKSHNDNLARDPRFSDPFFQVTVQENYDPLKKPQRQPPGLAVPATGLDNGPQSDIFFQRNPPGEDQRQRIFNPVIQKEAELKNRSKIDVTKERNIFVPSTLLKKQRDPANPEPKEQNYGSIRNISNVPAPSNPFSNDQSLNSSSFQKLSSFLDEINKLNG